jgi:hypothetical protein
MFGQLSFCLLLDLELAKIANDYQDAEGEEGRYQQIF